MASFYDRKNVNDNWTGSRRDDVMSGNGGDDIIRGAGGNDRIYGGNGNDRLFGDDGNDFLQGNSGNDVVDGGSGNDGIRGSSGTDTLAGGAGADTFVFDYAGDSRTVDGIDTVIDFNPAEGDVINIGATVEGYGYNNSYYWELVNAGEEDHTHQQMTLAYDSATGLTTLRMYFGDGDPDADMTLYIVGEHATDNGFLHIAEARSSVRRTVRPPLAALHTSPP